MESEKGQGVAINQGDNSLSVSKKAKDSARDQRVQAQSRHAECRAKDRDLEPRTILTVTTL